MYLPPPFEQADLLRRRIEFERRAFAVQKCGLGARRIPRRVARPWECREPGPAWRRDSSGCREGAPALRLLDQSISRNCDGGRSSAQTTAPPGILSGLAVVRRAAPARRDHAGPPDRRSAPADIRQARNCSPRSVRREPTTRPRPPAFQPRMAAKIGSRKSSSSSKAT